jgi:hypothetical protein
MKFCLTLSQLLIFWIKNASRYAISKGIAYFEAFFYPIGAKLNKLSFSTKKSFLPYFITQSIDNQSIKISGVHLYI